VLTANSKTDRAELEQELAQVDVVVSSTSSPGFVLDAETVERARNGRQLLFIDLAVPRDLDPAIHDLDGCFLYDIDDLEAIVSENPRRTPRRSNARGGNRRDRGGEVPRLASFARRGTCDRIAPCSRGGDPRGRDLRKAEGVLGRLDDAQRRAVESMTSQIVNKLLHLPTVRMKQAAVSADGVIYAEAVRHLFGLGEDER